MATWVMHKSGTGKKWEVLNTRGSAWLVKSPDDEPVNWDLPQSEFVPCDPPEQWEDVTDRIRVVQTTVPLKVAGSVDVVKCGDETIATLHCGGRYVVSFNPFTVKRRL